ncbi:MAG: hypothetical protein U5N85_11320 [Arcicella sp.]|nr:hypothetical protein [Arcicella sp.]
MPLRLQHKYFTGNTKYLGYLTWPKAKVAIQALVLKTFALDCRAGRAPTVMIDAKTAARHWRNRLPGADRCSLMPDICCELGLSYETSA